MNEFQWLTPIFDDSDLLQYFKLMCFSLAITIFALFVFAIAMPKPVVKNNGIAIKLTKHTPFPNPDNIVNVDALNAHVASLTAKVLRSLDNYEKNTGTIHPYALSGSGMRERGAGAPLMTDREMIWYGEISVGTPPATFSVEIDTGSSDMFLPWDLCDETCHGHTLWNADGSSSAKNLRKTFSVKFGDGSSAIGMQFVDNVTISGFTVDEQTIGAAYWYSDRLQKKNWAPDGILGMSFESISTYPANPLFATLADSKVIEPVFSVKLTPDGGELYIGGVNPNLYKGEFTYTPVTVQAQWQVEMQSIRDGKGNLLLTNIPVVIDTGATLIIGDPMRVSNMYNALGGINEGEGYYSFPCDSFPAISFSFNGKPFEMPPELLRLGEISSGSDRCFSSIVAQPTGAAFWLVGNIFLRGWYTTFEFGENPRVGFAELR